LPRIERNKMASLQAPLGSGLGAQTTTIEALGGADLTGKTAVVTGGYSGIGLATVRALAKAGATVIAPAKTPEKARKALSEIANVELETLDLFDPVSINEFAQRFLDSGRPLDLLIESAGIMAVPLTRDARGYEAQFAVNHLGHFQLTMCLWPALAAANGARVIVLSSRGHGFADLDLDDPQFDRRPYDPMLGYNQSKTANVLFVRSLDRRGISHQIRAFAVHPGTILDTGLTRHFEGSELEGIGIKINAERKVDASEFEANGGVVKSLDQGAATSIWAAVSPMLDGLGGVYLEECDVARVVTADDPSADGVRPWAIDDVAAEKLWALSVSLTGTDVPAVGKLSTVRL
jgi:NAD(P)-dependent dehydrogenase (short-subunit alcohol dehydrogenase family)